MGSAAGCFGSDRPAVFSRRRDAFSSHRVKVGSLDQETSIGSRGYPGEPTASSMRIKRTGQLTRQYTRPAAQCFHTFETPASRSDRGLSAVAVRCASGYPRPDNKRDRLGVGRSVISKLRRDLAHPAVSAGLRPAGAACRVRFRPCRGISSQDSPQGHDVNPRARCRTVLPHQKARLLRTCALC